MKFKACLFLILLTLFAGLSIFCPLKALAKELPGDPLPTARTPVEIRERKLEFALYEDVVSAHGTYTLYNPSSRKARIRLRFPLSPVESEDAEEGLKAWWAGEEIKLSYSAREKAYQWDITLEPLEELNLRLRYPLRGHINENGLLALLYSTSVSSLWAGNEKTKSSLSLLMAEIHPGQINNIKPGTYKILGNFLVWNWEGVLKEKIIVTGSTTKEKDRWIQTLNQEDKEQLEVLLEAKDYPEISRFFNDKSTNAKKEDREDLQVAEAYYLTKAEKIAYPLWENLYQEKALSSRVYWELGKLSAGQTEKLQDLYQRAKELQVHPLTQAWLATQLPSSKLKLSPPEFVLATAQLEEGNSGLIVKGHFSDRDGDIEQILLKYHWEDEPEEEISFSLEPFHYDYTPSQLIPAKKSLQRLFYEFIVLDRTGNETATGTKKSFYLNSEINSETYMLDGATLVLGDYPPAEQDEVRKWFMSYLKMAGEAQFIPVKAQNPYFIFLGKNHDFISNYKGPHFIIYTPAPFSPEAARLHVHRYFLSSWYGLGWQELPSKDLEQLGDALLLGKGRYTLVMRYLLHRDEHKFAELLGAIGQGKNWNQALLDVYQMPLWKVQINTIWFTSGNIVLAVFFIISFAWLGKTGYLVRMIRFFIPKERP